ncbi:type IV pilin-like G/H family protein [Microcoleus sp. FACHB-1515]|uniref:type IV pilin-like G/H family protein n=1 Tax=Cyanophyceae TaxID=3028117 RepID=UPI0016855AAB|nr:type IV pilin-like G/H family protein [Microcoleus sp. FACHB-1515]MBD2089458.1 type IV pilin-like G/H family protein [Microcoleus sp. FACHB-1515]
MKTELKAKFLQHLVTKNKDKGFTLIELLVVIIIIGILAAIALPSFLNQAAKAKMTEAKTTIGAVNRAQQAYRIENPEFATNFTNLEIGLPTATQDYTYTLTADAGNSAKIVSSTVAGDKSLKNFSGGVFVTDQGLTSVAACQTKQVATAAAVPTLVSNEAKCPDSMDPMR